MELEDKLQQVKERYDELNQAMADPAIYDRPREYAELTIEHTQLKELVEDYEEWKSLSDQISGNREVIEVDEDPEITQMAKDEIKELEARRDELEEEIKFKLIPKDPDDSKNCIIEIRAGPAAMRQPFLQAICLICTEDSPILKNGN